MPSYHHRPRQMPLTPPEWANYSGKRSGGHLQQPYSAKNIYGSNMFYTPPSEMYHPMNYNMPPSAPPGFPQPQQSFGPIAAPAPILPPLNMPDRSVDIPGQSSRREHHQEQQRSQQPQSEAKEEKAVGGVSAVLDYEMDQMSDYVSEMAQSIVMPGSPVSPPFRKFVSQLLSSTRLPSSTILLGMNYLARRMNMPNKPAPYKGDASVWRMLTIALLLGSKFLDDNTFQNRSWSEVSGIPVTELNTLEQEWLEAISWNLHVNPDTSEDFQCWLASWASWRDDKNKMRNATLERLAPLAHIDTNIQRNRSHQHKYNSPQEHSVYGIPQQSIYQAPSRYDQPSWLAPGSAQELSPPSAPESGPNTPEYLNLPNVGLMASEWSQNGFYSRRHQAAVQLPWAPNIAPYHTPYYGQYSSNVWSHGPTCGCGYCARPDNYNFMGNHYGQQAVVG